MKNKVVLITGSTDGIGKQTAHDLAKRGATIILHGRDKQKGESVLREIINRSGNNDISLYTADLASMTEVKKLIDDIKSKFKHLDILINNAGVFMKNRVLTPEGLEITFAVNYLSHFLVTLKLLESLKRSEQARIINVSSMSHQSSEIDFDNLQGEKKINGIRAYELSKLADIMFTYKLAELLKETKITVNCLHPGVINTKLLAEGFGNKGNAIEKGSKVPVYLATARKFSNITGKFYVKRRFVPVILEYKSAPVSYDKDIQQKLWDVSEKLSGVNVNL